MSVFAHRKFAISILFCAGLGLLVGRLGADSWPSVKNVFFTTPQLYFTSNKLLQEHYQKAKVMPLDWASLLPENELDVIARYQANKPDKNIDMKSQILLSIEAATDPEYKAALQSINTVNTFENHMVAISGFIVPIDFHPDKTVKNMFLVPYFGACLHYPAPPPNQIIFARLDAGFAHLELNRAYTLTGQIKIGLFEDPMGTSAYTLNVISIVAFNGQPDDFRNH
ncbi:DUF3299 domain-containing protein [Aliiglaciecola sp. 2_MG-2023]|uniref:DUF3299 domain-containing protein n=1 Tax=unclassified Aliiglaciecola TaxID=2593648 RepID=UPI0026E383A7|nr:MULTISPECIES: DUF3299 domain-containing protein [unclassified Aliiglaciecola]MDO6711707.1 DUF3299 domain-containing protein [Aliiglaciecola sp. 2_MG-2023]MDO6752778.1 DUF3299 domain-containing protein [Aliiglaciecola sp. 1_MG-2023]